MKKPPLFTSEDVRVLAMAEYRYGFCPRTESCVGCDACEADWQRFLSIRERITDYLPYLPLP